MTEKKREYKFRDIFVTLNQAHIRYGLSKDRFKQLVRCGDVVEGIDYRTRFTSHTKRIELYEERIPMIQQMIGRRLNNG